ncbi:MAG: efflux RND transporter permease subunit, partial [Muribaculaceae bacterium]|nr:efflux RND transporter permease subunit [Muribaculaceae bacterium]
TPPNPPPAPRLRLGGSEMSIRARIPLAVNGDMPGNEIQSPMAIVILGGLISSTILNMYVVPAIYYLINRKK